MRSKTVKCGDYKVHVRVAGSPKRIIVQPIWDGLRTLYAKLTSRKARELGKALIQIADEMESKKR